MRIFTFLLLLLGPLSVQANCIMAELEKQTESMDGYYPEEIAHAFTANGLPLFIRSALDNPEIRGQLVEQSATMIQQIEGKYQSDELRQGYYQYIDEMLESKGGPLSIWQLVMSQAARKCMERGEL